MHCHPGPPLNDVCECLRPWLGINKCMLVERYTVEVVECCTTKGWHRCFLSEHAASQQSGTVKEGHVGVLNQPVLPPLKRSTHMHAHKQTEPPHLKAPLKDSRSTHNTHTPLGAAYSVAPLAGVCIYYLVPTACPCAHMHFGWQKAKKSSAQQLSENLCTS